MIGATTRRRLEKPHAGRIADLGHGHTRQIESEPLLRAEPAMLAWCEMLHPINIRRPLDPVGILRAGDHETVLFLASEFAKQRVEGWLPIRGRRAQISEIPAAQHFFGKVDFRIAREIETIECAVAAPFPVASA